MPWLLGTALVHSITVQDRRRMLHAWNIFLVISTFSLSLLGTFLVRSGVLSSVHAFAVDPGRGAYILVFMTVVLTVSFGIFMVRGRYQQAEEAITSLMSRESLFVWNNVLCRVAVSRAPRGAGRRANSRRVGPRLLWPFAVGTTAAMAVSLCLPAVHWTGPVATGVALFALVSLIIEYSRAVRQRRAPLKEPLGRACLKTLLGNRRHYGR